MMYFLSVLQWSLFCTYTDVEIVDDYSENNNMTVLHWQTCNFHLRKSLKSHFDLEEKMSPWLCESSLNFNMAVSASPLPALGTELNHEEIIQELRHQLVESKKQL